MSEPSSTFVTNQDVTRGPYRKLERRPAWQSARGNWEKMSDAELVDALRAELEGDASSRSMAIRAVVERYQQRRRQGEQPDIDLFCDNFKALGRRVFSSIYREIELADYFASHPAVMAADQNCDWPNVGEEYAGFFIEEELGRGGIGRVYLCRQPDLGNRQVVVKMSRHKTSEAATLGKLTHPNITPIYHTLDRTREGFNYIVMPFLGRRTLDELIGATGKSDPLPASEVLDIATKLADALAFAHEQGIIHGDIKPSNVLLTDNGEPLLLDFNLSHDSQLDVQLRGGTLPYMSPEQMTALTNREFDSVTGYDERTDVYALGAMLYHLLSGTVPYPTGQHGFLGRDVVRRLVADRRTPPTRLHELNPSVSLELAQIVEQCLAAEPDQRFATMRHVHEALVAEQFRQLTIATAQQRQQRYARMRRTLLVGILVCVAGVIGARWLREPLHLRLYEEALLAIEQDRFKEANTLLYQALLSRPDFLDARYMRMQVAIAQGRLDDAMKEFNATSADAHHPHIRALAGWCDNMRDHNYGARAYYEEAIEQGLKTAGVYNNLGFSYAVAPHPEIVDQQFSSAGERLKAAMNCFQQALQINPDLAAVRLNIVLTTLDWQRIDPGVELAPVQEHVQWLLDHYADEPMVYTIAVDVALASGEPPSACAEILKLASANRAELSYDDVYQWSQSSTLMSDPDFRAAYETAAARRSFHRGPVSLPRLVDPRSDERVSVAGAFDFSGRNASLHP